MIDSRDFLDAVAGYANSPTNGPKSASERPVRLGTLDPNYTNGPARVVFDGDTVASEKGYSWVSSYSPVNGERVFLIPVGQSYIIGGKLTSRLAYSRYVQLPLTNGWINFDTVNYQPGSFTKTETGVVKLTGMISGGGVAQGTVIGTLPLGFRPPRTLVFPAMSNQVGGSLKIQPDGKIVCAGYSHANWVSLSNIIFPTATLTWNNVTHLNSFTVPADPSVGVAQYAKDAQGRVWFRGGLGRASAPAGDTPMFNVPAGFRPALQHHLPASSLGNGAASSALIDSTSGGDIRFKQLTSSMSTISLAGVMYPEASIGGWINGTYQNSWVSNNAPMFGAASYRLDADGVVHLRGLVQGGAIGSVIFNLPAGFRPSKTIIRSNQSSNTQGRLDIHNNGNVLQQMGTAGGWVTLDGIQFTAEQ